MNKRVKNGELEVGLTDKSGKLCVIAKEMWEKMGQVHVNKDKEVTWDEVQAAQRRIKGHLRYMSHIMNPGAESGQEERVREALQLRSTVIPVVSLLVKDHKPWGEDGTPKSRPV